MESPVATLDNKDLIDKLRKAAYIHFNKDDIMALEELIRRYKYAYLRSTSEQ